MIGFRWIDVSDVNSAKTALPKIEAGADLVQLYTAMICRGPGIANDITRELSAALDGSGAAVISNLLDATVKEWVTKGFELSPYENVTFAFPKLRRDQASSKLSMKAFRSSLSCVCRACSAFCSSPILAMSAKLASACSYWAWTSASSASVHSWRPSGVLK